MTTLLDRRYAPASMKHAEHEASDKPVRQSIAPSQCKRLEHQAARTREAFEHLDRSETKLKTSATQILLAILHYAASLDDAAS